MKQGRVLLNPKPAFQPPSFFFRSNDDLNTTDNIQNEYTLAKEDLTRAKKQLEEANCEFSSVKDILDDRDGHAIEYAESLMGNNHGQLSKNSLNSEQANLRRKIAELTVEVESLDFQLADVKRYVQPDIVEQMEHDRTTYFNLIKNQKSKLAQIQKKTRDQQIRLFNILISQQWHDATKTATEHQIACRIKSILSSHIKTPDSPSSSKSPNHGSFSKADSLHQTFDGSNNQISIEKVSPEIKLLIQKKHQLEQECQEAQNRRICAQVRRRVSIASLLDELQRLDAALRTLDQEGLRVSELRRNYLPEGPFSPMKRPKSSAEAARSRAELAPKQPGRSQSDIKRLIRGGKSYIATVGKC
ncbi:hypothetical protein TRFO_36678 [Tritrichomonas foetus]|uniref:Uncharacterized protein n=1 Tax=Tritrichomonas foetus TaxID=1144522 RepID=A0A1J4JDC3_9EUKA|nr:hypothetical protein TRFO_36678 [Tritrichomonas foetus]|eukprot:OHS97154.1 hypothetical protein TRFO_36678 [Tritrichomonas foetus]